jgi:glycosyltransferase involved in cell wall biosynthesis
MNKGSIHIGMNGSMLDEKPTGVGIYSINMINHLSLLYSKEHNRKITVFTPTKTLLNDNVKTIRLSRFLKSSQYGKIAAFTRFVWNTFCYPLRAGKFDLLVSTTTHGSFLLKNQIITIHDLLSLRFNNISRHQRFYFKYLLPFMVSKAKLIIAISETTKKDIVHFLRCPEDKVKVIYNGYDDELYNGMLISEKKVNKQYGVQNYFLAIGPTYPHKNFELLIDAHSGLDAAIREKYPLVIAGGKKEYLAVLKKYIAEKKAENCIYFIGYVPISLMPSLYKEAFALVFPSLYEGFGFPLLEAMASGCPVIASDVSSIPEVCAKAVLYFDPYNTQSLKLQLERIITDEKLYNDLKEKGLNRAKEFSWPKAAGELKKIIEEAIH